MRGDVRRQLEYESNQVIKARVIQLKDYQKSSVAAPVGRYLLRFALSIDQLANVLLGGHEDETMSSRIGRMKRRHGGRIPWRRPIIKVVDRALDLIDKNHTLDAIEPWTDKACSP